MMHNIFRINIGMAGWVVVGGGGAVCLDLHIQEYFLPWQSRDQNTDISEFLNCDNKYRALVLWSLLFFIFFSNSFLAYLLLMYN